MPKVIDRSIFVKAARAVLGDVNVISRQDVIAVCEKKNIDWPNWLTNGHEYRFGRGQYRLPDASGKVSGVPMAAQVSANSKKVAPAVIPNVVPTIANNAIGTTANMSVNTQKASDRISEDNEIALVPEKAKGYVPFGHYNDVKTIITSKLFYPMFITGLSGNGKTMMVEQVCADSKREMIRANITEETDEDDLIGGFRLVDGQTVWQNGPVVVAMERGAILLLDECDLGSVKLMCLQPVLEGKPIYLKKINKVITPAPGFNIVATANTKGKGSDDGRFVGTRVMNEAFLERFSITLEQEYPAQKTEMKILNNVLKATGLTEWGDFTEMLTNWSDVIRKTFVQGGSNELVTTRRLVHICQAYAIFGQNRMKAIELCLSRFDQETKDTFIQLYKKMDDSVNPKPVQNDFTANIPTNTASDEVPF